MKDRPQPRDCIIWEKKARRPGQDRPRQNKQHEPRSSGQVRTQHKERRLGGAETQGGGRGQGDAVQRRCGGAEGKRGSRPVMEAELRQRSGHEGKAEEFQRSRVGDDAQ